MKRAGPVSGRSVLSLLCLVACSPSPRETTSARAARPQGCPDPSELPRAETRYREARALIEACDELCRKSGKEDPRAWPWLREAVDAGHREAQAFYGMRVFDFMLVFSEDEAKDMFPYVTSLSNLRLAARRGSPLAREYLPALATLAVEADGSFRPALEPPLSLVPAAWLRQAIRQADDALRCYR